MYQPNETLNTIVKDAIDNRTVIEIYPDTAKPPFDPEDAILRLSAVNNLSVFGLLYDRLVLSFGRPRRTAKQEKNSFSATLDNLNRDIADFEFDEGFEGKIMVVRLLSQSLTADLEDSLILFAGQCKKPDSGNKRELTVEAEQIFGSLDREIPRRKFTPEDSNGRTRSDPLFEGFIFLPQTGTTVYYRRKSFLGLIHWKKKKNLPWSSFTDIDADKYLPFGFGRVQPLGTHLGYADVGTKIRTTTAFLEGQIKDYIRIFSTDYKFTQSGTIHKRYGELGGVGSQIPIGSTPAWVADGYYSRTAWVGTEWGGTNIEDTDPAPDVAALILAAIVKILNDDEFTTDEWSDNAAALVRHLLTSEDYENLHEDWINNDSAVETYKYNDEFLFDKSFSDLIFVPTGYQQENIDSSRFLRPTGSLTTNYLLWLKGIVEAAEAFGETVMVNEYSSIIPVDPDDFPEINGVPNINLSVFLRRRYTCSGIANEKQNLWDWLNEAVLPNSRMFLTQGFDGKIHFKHKKPVDFALGTDAFTSGTDEIELDDVSKWISNKRGQILIQPHSGVSEVRAVTDANYDTAQNSVTLSASANITVSGFSGCDGAETPATATITIDDVLEGAITPNSITLDGEQIAVIANALDTNMTLAGFFYGSINAHPRLRRKFTATWEDEVVTITAKFGTISLDSDLEEDHPAPLANPTTAPTLTATASGSLAAGVYRVGYAYENANGRTLMATVGSVTLTANQKITVTAITPPAGVDSVVWYVSPEKGSLKLRFHLKNNGAGFVIDSLPRLNAGLPNDFNRTGTEIMRVMHVFSDRALTRSNITKANVLKSTYKWILGRREESTNLVVLNFRDATQDYRAVELRIPDEDHIEKVKKENKLEIDGSTIDSFHQAYRIASGALTEARDADFFYQCESDREALFLEEVDVVCVTDAGAGVVNFPVIIEDIEYDRLAKGHPTAQFVTRKYSSTLYDDSVVEREIPIFQEADKDALALLGENETEYDIEILDADKGLILTDRTTSTRYRIYIDDGHLEIEEVV